MATTSSPGCRAAALPKGRAWKLAQQMLTTARSRTLSVTQDRAAIGSGIVYYDADLYFTFDDVMVGDDVPGLALRLEDDPRAGPRTGLNPHNGGPDLLHNRTQRRRRVFGWRGSRCRSRGWPRCWRGGSGWPGCRRGSNGWHKCRRGDGGERGSHPGLNGGVNVRGRGGCCRGQRGSHGSLHCGFDISCSRRDRRWTFGGASNRN